MKNSENIKEDNKYYKERVIESYKEYDIYLNDEIKNPKEYVELLNILKIATKEDKVNIFLNNNGGYLDTAIQIVNSIENCKSKVTTIINGACHSAASIIFLAGHKKVVEKSSYMLCHYYSNGIFGKGNELIENAKFSDKHFKNFFRRIYTNFLTKSELSKMFKGEDFWLDDEEIKKRIK